MSINDLLLRSNTDSCGLPLFVYGTSDEKMQYILEEYINKRNHVGVDIVRGMTQFDFYTALRSGMNPYFSSSDRVHFSSNKVYFSSLIRKMSDLNVIVTVSGFENISDELMKSFSDVLKCFVDYSVNIVIFSKKDNSFDIYRYRPDMMGRIVYVNMDNENDW